MFKQNLPDCKKMTTAEIQDIWRDAKLTPPTHSLLLDAASNELFIVIDDTSTVYRLMDQFGNVVGVVPQSCSVANGTYQCQGQFFPIRTHLQPRDQFALDNILPVVF